MENKKETEELLTAYSKILNHYHDLNDTIDKIWEDYNNIRKEE